MDEQSIPLMFDFLGLPPEAERHVRDFFNICREKFRKGERKYGYLRGPGSLTPDSSDKIYNHLLIETGELICAVNGEDYELALKVIEEAIKTRLKRKKDRNIPSELADVTNLPVLVYTCWKMQGII